MILGILRDKTMDYKSIQIHNDYKQAYPFCCLISLVERFGVGTAMCLVFGPDLDSCKNPSKNKTDSLWIPYSHFLTYYGF